MSRELIEHMERAQTYIRYNQKDIEAEIKRTKEARLALKAFETELKAFLRTLKRTKTQLYDKSYQKALIDVWRAFPELTTIRQIEIILRSLKRMPNKDAAVDLFLTEKGIKWHKTKAFKKLGVKNTEELIVLAQSRMNK